MHECMRGICTLLEIFNPLHCLELVYSLDDHIILAFLGQFNIFASELPWIVFCGWIINECLGIWHLRANSIFCFLIVLVSEWIHEGYAHCWKFSVFYVLLRFFIAINFAMRWILVKMLIHCSSSVYTSLFVFEYFRWLFSMVDRCKLKLLSNYRLWWIAWVLIFVVNNFSYGYMVFVHIFCSFNW